MSATQGIESRTHQSETAAEVVGRLRATFNTGVTRPLDWRVDQLQRLRALLVENEQELLDALWADLRKNAAEAKMQEIDFTVADIDEALANLENWLEPRPVEVPAHFGPTTTAYTTYDPLGVVLVIAPWNFPLHLLIDPIIGALAAGNTVVAKPSEMSVHTSAVAARLLRQYFDADVLTVVEGGAEETTALLAQRFDQIFYTGNGTVGRIVMAAAAKNLTPVTLELGGKSPVFVAPDADVDETAMRLVGAKFGNAGQQCIAPDYVLADPATAAALVPALRAAVEAQFGSSPQTSAGFGRIINETFTEKGEQPYPVPEAMTTAEIRAAVEDFTAAARRAIEAGADGVEIHGANGYLLQEFLSPAANQRTDEYGGSPHNRARFVVEVVTAVAQAVGAERVGLRISPEVDLGDVFETDRDDVLATYGTLMDQLRPLGLAYLSVLHAEPGGDLVQELRRRFDGKLIVNNGPFGGQTTREQALQQIEAGHADAVAVGRALIANPDLVARWQGGHPENEPRPELFYGPGAEGYTDYPFLEAA
ncbi:aldehyde dehydrogenase family protein [Streptomyces sp. NPDC002144]